MNPETVPSNQGDVVVLAVNAPELHVLKPELFVAVQLEKFEEVPNCKALRPFTPGTEEPEFPTPVVFAGEIVAPVFQ